MAPEQEKMTLTKTEDRILQNALYHFCNFGYNGTSVREITSASEVTKPTLYYYFKNKEELFTRLAETCFQLVMKHLEEASNGKQNYANSVKALFKCMDQIATENLAALKFIHGLIVAPQRGTPDVGASKFIKQIEDHLDGILLRAVKDGECLESKRKSMHLVFSALLGYHSSLVMAETKQDQVIETLNLVIHNLVGCSHNKNCPPAE